MNNDFKRQNFNVDADQAADLEAARIHLHAATVKDAMLRAARLVNTLARELQSGQRLMLLDNQGNATRFVISDLEQGEATDWVYLCERPHPWRRQLYIKGRKLLASMVWNDMLANGFTVEEAAIDRDLPVEAVIEAVSYCERNLDLIKMESAEEKTRLLASGVLVGD